MYGRIAFAFGLAFLSASVHLRAADGGPDAEPRVEIIPQRSKPAVTDRASLSNLRSDVRVVLVPVSVTDALNRPITDLSQDRFRVLEDGVEQKITSFAREEGPVSLGLLFDSSGSMKNRVTASVAALKHLFQTTVEGDEFFLAEFSDDVRLPGGFTSDPEEIHRRLGLVQATGWTALLDAIALSTNQMKSAKNPRRALLILSDGNDNNSRYSEAEIRSRVVEADLRIYAIALSYRPRLLQRLAEETGGNVLTAQDISELPDVVQRLSAEIRSQYLLGYSPSNPASDGKYRKVKIELMQPAGASPLRAAWRRGYYAEGWSR